jgi:hypothetical protein
MKIELTPEIINMTISLLTLFVYIAAAIIAYRAVTVYQKQTKELNNQNEIQIDLSLRGAYNEIVQLVEKDGYLIAFFADFPEDEEPSVELAHRQINLFLDTGTFEGWSNTEDLMKRLYELTPDFHNPIKARLRRAYHLAEQLLYLLHDAFTAYRAGILTDVKYESWIVFVDDVGFHPLFLSAILYGHSGGYITKDFAEHIKARLQQNERNRKAIKVIYSDMLNNDWLKRLGNQQYNRTAKK